MLTAVTVSSRVAEWSPSTWRSTSMRSPRGGDAVVAGLVVAAVVVVAEHVALDLDVLAGVVTIEHVASPSSTSMRSPRW